MAQRIQNRPLLESAEAVFARDFGSVKVAPDGILPTVEPTRARSLLFPLDGKLVYQPDSTVSAAITEEELRVLRYLVIWSPRRLLFAWNYGEAGQWQYVQQLAGDSRFVAPDHYRLVNTTAMARIAAEPVTTTGRWQLPQAETFSAQQIFTVIDNGIWLSFFGVQFFAWFIMPLFYTAVFCFVFKLTGGASRLQALSFSQFWKIGIYAGFPVMPVAACFPAFDLPFFNPMMVFMAGLVIYWLLVVGRIERAAMSSDKEE